MLPNQTFSRLHRSDNSATAWLAQVYVVVSGLIAALYAVLFVRRRAPWPMGDWLINYEGGFVRRGMPGEIILQCSRFSHVPLIWVAAALQIGCVIVFTLSLCWLTGKTFFRPTSLWQKALLLSPATLAFVWFDPSLILRKEIGLFAALGLLAWLLSRSSTTDFALVVYVSVVCLLLLFSHEGLVCYLPYLFAMVVLGKRSFRRALKLSIVPVCLSLLPIALATRYTGNALISSAVCTSIGGPQTGLCSGPIYYLGLSRQVYEGEVQLLLHDKHILWAFAITTSLALLPIFSGLVDLWRRPVSRNTRWVLPTAFALSSVASMVLFVEAQDWSRWIYIHMICLLLTLFFAAAQRNEELAAAPHQASSTRLRTGAMALVLFAYATTWHLPEWILPGAREYRPFGYSSLLSRISRHAPEGELRDWHAPGTTPPR